MCIPTTGPAVKNHISPKKGKRIDCNKSIYVPFIVPGLSTSSQRPHLLRHHLHHRIPYLTKPDTPKIQYQKEVEVRVRSYGETGSINRQKPKTKNKNEGREEVQSDLLYELPDWLQEFREILVGETLRLKNKTLPVLLMNYK